MCRLCNDQQTVAMHAGSSNHRRLPHPLRGPARRRLLLDLHQAGRITLQDKDGLTYDLGTVASWADARIPPDEVVFVPAAQVVEIERAIRSWTEGRGVQDRLDAEESKRRAEEEATRRAEERRQQRRQWIAELKAAGRWDHPEFRTILQARAAGYRDPEPDDYGGEQIELKGHTLVRNCQKAVSETEWRRRGFKLKSSQQPHGLLTGCYSSWYVYRGDQVVPFEKLPQKTPKAIHVLAAVWTVNRSAKRCRNAASGCYEWGHKAQASVWSKRKSGMYVLKAQALHHLVTEGRLQVVGYHRFQDNWAEVLRGEDYTFHRPCPPPSDDVQSKQLEEIEAKPRGTKEPRLKDALYTLESYLDGKGEVEVFQWPSRPGSRPVSFYEDDEEEGWDDDDDEEFGHDG